MMSIDFVDCSIDQDEMRNGQTVASALRRGKDGGIPWFVFLDPSEPILFKREDDSKWTRREAAVLATADADEGNVGCPITLPERQHFTACLQAARISLSEEQILRLAQIHSDFASKKNADDGIGTATIAQLPPSFDSLEEGFNNELQGYLAKLREQGKGKPIPLGSAVPTGEYFPKFRQLAKNYLAPPADRGRALMWCFKHFSETRDTWDNYDKVVRQVANSMIDNWANEDWAAGMADVILRSAALPASGSNYTRATALARLETVAKDDERKAHAAFNRTMLWKPKGEDEFSNKLESFIANYPDDKRVEKANGYLRNIRALQVGSIAPDFSGTNVDGNEIALSDYRGKVTYLVFWGFW